MTWWSVEVWAPARHKERLGAWLVNRTGQAVEERDESTLVAFASGSEAAQHLVDDIGRETEGRVRTDPRPIESVDWSLRWRDGLGVRRLNELSIIPSWLPEATTPGPYDVVLDPETAFGSGEHGSTRVALTLTARLLRKDDVVLDLGSGSGILAIAAAKLGASRAWGIELDQEAIAVAERNAARNQVDRRVAFLQGDAAALAPLLGPADLVLSNILRVENARLLPVISRALKPQSIGIFSGMEVAEAEEFRQTLDLRGFIVIEEAIDSAWWGVAARCP
ncbi:MAG TPA: 50S ribosomal protein L11 methyltransferase [Gemmatimonadales bacterium]|nr:50S ribosomal protein L11 methyltransferase [Gemmatimonadales bacterium]